MRICIIIKKWSGHPSFKRRGNVSDIYSILYILFWTKVSLYFTIGGRTIQPRAMQLYLTNEIIISYAVD
jgi:hypothetical protein